MFEDVVKFKNSKEWIRFENYYNDKSFTEQLGLFRYEDVHTNFLASLLNNNNIYGYGYKPIKLFLELIKIKNNNKEGIKYLDEINSFEEYEISNLIIDVRKKLKSGTPDLYIQFNLNNKKYLIILEAKLESSEHDNQCDNYYNDVNEKKEFDEKIFVYLTLDGGQCSNNHYNLITYQDLINYLYEPLTYMKSNSVALTISEYLKSFSLLYEIEFKNFNNYPMTNEGKQLTIDLWNRTLEIKKMWTKKGMWIQMYKNNPYVFKAFIINILKLKDELKPINNNLTKYYDSMKNKITIDNEDVKTKTGVHDLIVKLVEYYSKKSIEEIDSRIIVTTGKWQNIIADSKINSIPKEKKEYYKQSNKLILNNEKYWYVETRLSDVENFIKVLHECYPEFANKIKIKPYIKGVDC